jgi:hypothetical protein
MIEPYRKPGRNHPPALPSRAGEEPVKERITKRQVQKELPDRASLLEHGLALDLEEARLVLAVASRMIVHGRANHRDALSRATRALGLAVSLELEDEDGTRIARLLDPPKSCLAPHGATAERKLGFSPSTFNKAWSEGSVYVTSCLPLSVVLAYLPAPAWPYIAAFIGAGPFDARDRLSQAASIRGLTATWKALDAQFSPAQTLMACLVKLYRDYQAANERRTQTGKELLPMPELLGPWTFVPDRLSTAELKVKARGGRNLPTSAVPEELVKERLHELARAADWGRWPPEKWPLNRNWKQLKDLALLAVEATLCPRVEHLANLDVRDVVAQCTFRDGTVGHAIIFRGGDFGLKNRDETYAFAVRLPTVLYDILVAWMSCNAETPTSTARSGQTLLSHEVVSPLFPSRKKRHPTNPQRPHANLDDSFKGRKTSTRSGRTHPLVEDPNTPGLGFQPHRYRSTLTQGLDRIMKAWSRDNPDHQLAGYPDDAASECVLDHTKQDLGYRDFREGDDPSFRFEQIVALGVSLWWNELWRDGPYLHRGLDPAAIMRSHERVQVLEAQLVLIDHEREVLKRRSAALVEHALERADPRDQVQALLQSNALRDEREAKLEDKVALKEGLEHARAELNQACTTEVLLPEDVGPKTHASELAAALAAICSEPTEPAQPTERILAEEYTTADIALPVRRLGTARQALACRPLEPSDPARMLDRIQQARPPRPPSGHRKQPAGATAHTCGRPPQSE